MYFKERIFITVALMIGIFNPFIGFGITFLVYWNAKNRKRLGFASLRKDDELFMVVSMILLVVVAILNLILIFQGQLIPDPNGSESAST